MIDVTDFGAVGNGIVDDTLAIQRASLACTTINTKNDRVKAVKPEDGSYLGSCQPLFFPSGKYKISDSLLISPYQDVFGEAALLIQSNNSANIFEINGYQNRISGMQFCGGRRQINYHNDNIDGSLLTIEHCNFQGWSDRAIFAESLTGDLHLSTSLYINRCKFDGAQAIYTHCDKTEVANCEAKFRGLLVPPYAAWLTNVRGVAGLTSNTLTPAWPTTPSKDGREKSVKAYWIDNRGSVVCERVRFGGEGAGVPILIHRRPPVLTNPWRGDKVAFCYCQLSCGQDASQDSAVVTLDGGFPQCLHIVGCDGVVSNNIPLARVAPGYDLDADVAAVLKTPKGSLGLYSWLIQGNQIYSPAPLPAALEKIGIR